MTFIISACQKVKILGINNQIISFFVTFGNMDSKRIQNIRNLGRNLDIGEGEENLNSNIQVKKVQRNATIFEPSVSDNPNNNIQVRKVERNATTFDSSVDDILGRTGFNVFTQMTCKDETNKVEKLKQTEYLEKESYSLGTCLCNLFISCIV